MHGKNIVKVGRANKAPKIIKRTKWSVQTNQRFKLYNNVNLALGNGGDLDCHAFWLVCDEEEQKKKSWRSQWDFIKQEEEEEEFDLI